MCACGGWYCTLDRLEREGAPPPAPGLLARMNGDVELGPQPTPEDVVRHQHSDAHGTPQVFHEHVGGSLPHEHGDAP